MTHEMQEVDRAHRNNNFAFSGQRSLQFKCPFAAHIRRTNPRDDLEVPPDGTDPISVEPNRIMRRGIPFGPELTIHEQATGVTENSRGLLFVCYQSSLVNGFQKLQNGESLIRDKLLHNL